LSSSFFNIFFELTDLLATTITTVKISVNILILLLRPEYSARLLTSLKVQKYGEINTINANIVIQYIMGEFSRGAEIIVKLVKKNAGKKGLFNHPVLKIKMKFRKIKPREVNTTGIAEK